MFWGKIMRVSLVYVLVSLFVSSGVMAQGQVATDSKQSPEPAKAQASKSKVPNTANQNKKTISDADLSVISSTILCENLPQVNTDKATEAYSRYLEQVYDFFGDNAEDIHTSIVGINHDHQMTYKLNTPVNIVGISFDAVNIITLKGQGYNYYQFTAVKPLLPEDQSLIKNIPENDNLTVSTKDKKLSIICNVKLPEHNED